jgi:hypothetical protein
MDRLAAISTLAVTAMTILIRIPKSCFMSSSFLVELDYPLLVRVLFEQLALHATPVPINLIRTRFSREGV